MFPRRSTNARPRKLSGKVLATVLVATLIPSIAAQSKLEQTCRGLHAAIRGELSPPYAHPPFVQLTFVLMNDSENPINAVEEGWKLVIDGKELKDSDFIICCGPRPAGGWGTLQPGESYEFGVAMERSKYFPEAREYQVYWKGKGFQSSTIIVNVTRQQ